MTKGLFTQIDDAHVITKSKGVYRQTPVYQRGALLYAKHGAGFIRLLSYRNGTSNPDVIWEEIIGMTVGNDKLGNMI